MPGVSGQKREGPQGAPLPGEASPGPGRPRAAPHAGLSPSRSSGVRPVTPTGRAAATGSVFCLFRAQRASAGLAPHEPLPAVETPRPSRHRWVQPPQPGPGRADLGLGTSAFLRHAGGERGAVRLALCAPRRLLRATGYHAVIGAASGAGASSHPALRGPLGTSADSSLKSKAPAE